MKITIYDGLKVNLTSSLFMERIKFMFTFSLFELFIIIFLLAAECYCIYINLLTIHMNTTHRLNQSNQF